MPNYDYECQKCGKVQERFTTYPFRDLHAPECCGKPTKRLIGANLMPFRFPYYHTNIAPEPILMTSRKQEVREFESRRLADGR